MKDYKRILQGIVNIINITKKSDIVFSNICAYIDEKCPELKEQGEQKSLARYKVGDTIYYNSFGRLVSFTIANIVEDGTNNPMYEDKDGNSVFQNDIVEQNPVIGMKTPEESLGIDSDTYNKIADKCVYVEQKPAEWSEEDESMRKAIILNLEEFAKTCAIPSKEYVRKCINWFKNLSANISTQKHWKPSDAQMKALKEACDEHWEPDGLDPLYTLYQDLKEE